MQGKWGTEEEAVDISIKYSYCPRVSLSSNRFLVPVLLPSKYEYGLYHQNTRSSTSKSYPCPTESASTSSTVRKKKIKQTLARDIETYPYEYSYP
eukprot:scaffold55958_cov20-Prasinocladus_malaysianus.AAC.1